MKKILSAALVIVLILALNACTVSDGGEIIDPSSVLSGNTNTAGTGNTGGNSPSAAKTSIEEAVLLDEGGIKITAKSLDSDALFGPELKLLIENDSGKDLTFQCRNVSVNGYMVDTMMSVNVANGKKANDSITFVRSDLEACGITDIADMDFAFYIFSTSNWETYLETEQLQLKTSIADTYTYSYDDSGSIAYDANDIKVIIKGLSEDSSILGPSIVVYIENNANRAVTVQSQNVSVNGFMIDAVFSCDIMPGKKAVDTITFTNSDLQKNEISAITDVELSFLIFDCDSWDTIAQTDTVTMSF